MPTLSLLVREKYFLRRPYSRTFKFEGGRALEIDHGVMIVWLQSCVEAINAEDDAVEQEAVQQLGVREQ